ncbi:hypothetical protein [Massilia psychrophila]|nr:hypothetical protein [Massilia psychrophila]
MRAISAASNQAAVTETDACTSQPLSEQGVLRERQLIFVLRAVLQNLFKISKALDYGRTQALMTVLLV